MPMNSLSRKSTIYFAPETHRKLRLRATNAETSVSRLVDEAVRLMLSEDEEDLATFAQRDAQPEISYRALLADLKQHGKL